MMQIQKNFFLNFCHSDSELVMYDFILYFALFYASLLILRQIYANCMFTNTMFPLYRIAFWSVP